MGQYSNDKLLHGGSSEKAPLCGASKFSPLRYHAFFPASNEKGFPSAAESLFVPGRV